MGITDETVRTINGKIHGAIAMINGAGGPQKRWDGGPKGPNHWSGYQAAMARIIANHRPHVTREEYNSHRLAEFNCSYNPDLM